MTSLCWLASVSPFPGSSFSHSALIETECITQQAPHDYFNKKSSKCGLVGIVKKLIRLICRDCSSGGEEGPRAMCGSVVCRVGCDEWVERMLLICAWKASQQLTRGDTHLQSEAAVTRCLWCQGRGLCHRDIAQLATNQPLFNLVSHLVHGTMRQDVNRERATQNA